MKTKYILSSFLSFSLLVGCAYSKSFSFTPKEPQWSFYGEGTGAYVSNTGRDKDQTSLWLSTDWGESETAYFTWNDLSPGLYKVITYVRAQDVQKGSEGASFWHFYDGGFGTVSPFMDLHGDYDWRKIEYTIKVKDKDLTVWFRLKAPGQVWVDDFYLEKVETGNDKVSIEPAAPLKVSGALKKLAAKTATKKILYTFDKSEPGHPFDLKNKAGTFSPQKFFNFKVDKMPVKDWSAYDRIEMDVFNPNENYIDFYLTLADDQTTNYWSQVNHKQTLAPGWNKLNFSLTQYVGERGSHRFQRSINLSKLNKVFVVIDPDSKNTYENKNFLIDNIALTANPMPAIPENVWAFDFTSQKANNNTNLTQVTTQTSFNEARGFGFVEPKFWRVEDSQYASEMLRYSIGMLGGHFRVKLPNGKYQMNLVVDKLGYWDVPFWSDRTVYANGTPIFKETRGSAGDFLGDLLRFEGITPESWDHPYDLYLSKVFYNIDKTVDVSNGYLDLEFDGDATGISLNSLVLWSKSAEAQAQAYKIALEKRNKLEFDWMSRAISKDKTNPSQKFSAVLVEPDLYLNPTSAKKASGTTLSFQGGIGDTPYQLIQLTASASSDEKISWSFGDFTNEKGEKIAKGDLNVSELVFQYTSPDINHETYLLTGKYLKPLKDVSVVVKKSQNKYLWLQTKIGEKTPQGVFKGEVVLHRGSEKISFPTEITVLNYTLPKVDFPVGFFGLDPLPYSYFPKNGYNDLRKKYRYMALSKLGEAGFTTFTGLPEDTSELNDLFKEALKWGIQTVYSYGGQFPQAYLDLNKKPGNMSEEEFYKRAADTLKPLLSKKDWPKIVHTFSDEAGGYSDKTASDIELAKKFQKYLPFMTLGGFGSFHGGDSAKLNGYFTYGFYSSLSKGDISRLKDNNLRWGFYNASAGNLDDPRFSFGLGLYVARTNGLSQYLEWHSSAFNNYPYYDFDGRESDVVMFFPTRDGKLLHSLRFELASEGLHAYKKLKLLENAVTSGIGNREALNSAKTWMDSLRRENYFYSSTTFMSNKKINFREFETKLNEHLKNVFLKK
nr:hypothetical protein BHI3_28090 [Bacteriovorax sp. HI3]